MGTKSPETTTQTSAVDPTISNFVNRNVLPNFGQPGFSTPVVPGNFPIGAGPDPLSQAAQGGLLSFLSGPFQQQFGNLQGFGNALMGSGFGNVNQGLAGVGGAQNFALQGLNPMFNPVLGFNSGLAGEASNAFSQILNGLGPGGGAGGGSGSIFIRQPSGGGASATPVDASALIDRTTTQLTDNFFERVLPGVTDRLIGTGNLGGSRGEILTANATEDFNQQLADTIAQIELGVSGQNLDSATRLGVANAQAGATLGAASSSANASIQNNALRAMLEAASGIQGGLNSGFSPFFNTAQNALMGGSQFQTNTGMGLLGQGFSGGQNLLNAPLQSLNMLNTFGLGNQSIMDSIIQRALPIFMSNNTTGLQDLNSFAGILGPLFGGTGTQTTTGPGASRGAGILGGAASGASTGSLFGPTGTGVGAVIGGILGGFG